MGHKLVLQNHKLEAFEFKLNLDNVIIFTTKFTLCKPINLKNLYVHSYHDAIINMTQWRFENENFIFYFLLDWQRPLAMKNLCLLINFVNYFLINNSLMNLLSGDMGKRFKFYFYSNAQNFFIKLIKTACNLCFSWRVSMLFIGKGLKYLLCELHVMSSTTSLHAQWHHRRAVDW